MIASNAEQKRDGRIRDSASKRLPSRITVRKTSCVDFFRDGRAAAHVQSEAINSGLPAAIKRHEGFFIAGGRPAQQRFVTDIREIRHAALIRGCNCTFLESG